MLVKKIETSNFLSAIFIFGRQISCLYAKPLYQYEPPSLLKISITNERIYKLFFFLLKTEIHTQILNTEPFIYKFRGLRYLRNKIGF